MSVVEKWALGVTIISGVVRVALRLRIWYWQRQVRKNEALRDALDAELARYR